ncbi:MAG: DDE-type integrase/transposase/recombinase [Planctomycetaceae bacterium]|nr:DDE-type integrase/transposase/recombinase [Planctomycetaceae bacterium]
MKSKRFTQEQKLAVLESGEQIGIKAVAGHAGVHYTTVYQWSRDLNRLGKKGFLEYKPSRPGRGKKKITPEQENSVLEVWQSNTGYGPGQVRASLRRQGTTISIRTIRTIMEANGYKPPKSGKERNECTRFEASRPLELCQMDILEFHINKLRVFLILLMDDCSRFILGWKLLEETSADEVVGLVAKAVDRYGKPEEILTDRGFVFYSWRGINRFEKWLESMRIDHTHARPHHPQTLGKVEACNRRIKNELIRQHRFSTFHEADVAIREWVSHYNYERPHQGIGGLLVPAERFHGREKDAPDGIAKGLAVNKGDFGIDRSIINLVMSPDGNLTLWFMGKPVINGGGHE